MTATKEMVGRKFGMLTVIKRIPSRIQPSGRKRVMWLCRCDCGNMKEASGACLRNGTTISCGCTRRKPNTKPKHESMPREGSYKDDLIGQRFGMLTVIGEGEPYIAPCGKIIKRYKCRCDCGNTRDVRPNDLRRDLVYSCGCKNRRPHEYKKRDDSDLIGQKIGLFTVLEETDPYITPLGKKFRRYKCRCECGNIRKIASGDLKAKRRYSCGCRRRPVTSRKPKVVFNEPIVQASMIIDIHHDLIIGQTYDFDGYNYKLLEKYPHFGLFLDPYGQRECFDWWTVQRVVKFHIKPDSFRFWARNT